MLPTANIGRVVAAAAQQSRHAEVVAVASRDGERARAFADELGIKTSYGSYDEMLVSAEIDAVYIALPVAMHTEWTLRALEAGKHVSTRRSGLGWCARKGSCTATTRRPYVPSS
jgi:predicted dehydrogenase